MGFTIQWKHVVVGFFLENNEKIHLFNNMISFVACRIYKYKMYCRLEGMNEHEIGIRQNIKQNVIFMKNVFKYSENSKHEKLFRKLSGMLWNMCIWNLYIMLLYCYRYTFARGILICWACKIWINTVNKKTLRLQ